jgi:hypothetical protein
MIEDRPTFCLILGLQHKEHEGHEQMQSRYFQNVTQIGTDLSLRAAPPWMASRIGTCVTTLA